MTQKQLLAAIKAVTPNFDVILRNDGTLNIRVLPGTKARVEAALNAQDTSPIQWTVTETLPEGVKLGIVKLEGNPG